MAGSLLPLELSSFVGRATELERIPTLFQSRRLVTVTGPGGIGKTRLALRAATTIRERYRDGVWLFDLSCPEERAAALPALGAQPELRRRQQLVILDNCEHVVGPCAELACSLLERCPEVHLLATSREVLHVPGEAIVLTPPLSLPIEKETCAERLQQSEAGWLFLDRLATSVPELNLTMECVADVADLLRWLEGVPLALELAAERVRSVGLGEVRLLARDSARLLNLGIQDVLTPGRQRTLRASLDWSFGALEHAERMVLRRLAMRGGYWTLADAVTACAHDDLSTSFVDIIGRLIAKSLVHVEHRGLTTRYRLLEWLREYVLEQPAFPNQNANGTRSAVRSTSLTAREREVLALLARGCSNKEIGLELAIASTTARVHVEHILTKLDLRSRTQAAVWALKSAQS